MVTSKDIFPEIFLNKSLSPLHLTLLHPLQSTLANIKKNNKINKIESFTCFWGNKVNDMFPLEFLIFFYVRVCP